MEKYSGNQKGFIYASCDTKGQKEVFEKYLEPLAAEEVNFCWGDAFDKKEEDNIAKSNAVILFLTKDYVKEDKLRKTVEAAVRHDKPILSIYLEDIELDAGLSMQLESQQALYLNKYKSDDEFIGDLKEAAIFDKIDVSGRQKKKQKTRVMIAVAVVAAALLVLAILIVQGMKSRAEAETLEALGLQGLSKSELESIEELRIVGTEIVDNDVWSEYNGGNASEIAYRNEETGEEKTVAAGSISDLSAIRQMKNLRVLVLDGQQIEDITPLLELDKLELLSLSCNPVSSLDGLEKLDKLDNLNINDTDVEYLPEDLHLKVLQANGSKLKKIPDFGGQEDVILGAAGGAPISDISNIGTAADYMHFHIDCSNVRADQIVEGLKGTPVSELRLTVIQIDSLQELEGIDANGLRLLDIGESSIRSLEGIEHFEGIEELYLTNETNLSDLSLVNKLESLKKLRITRDMEGLADAVDDRIEIEYAD